MEEGSRRATAAVSAKSEAHVRKALQRRVRGHSRTDCAPEQQQPPHFFRLPGRFTLPCDMLSRNAWTYTAPISGGKMPHSVQRAHVRKQEVR